MKEKIRNILKRGILSTLLSAALMLSLSVTSHAAWSGNNEDYSVAVSQNNLTVKTVTYVPSVQTLPSGYHAMGITESGGRAFYTCSICGATGEIKNIKLYGYQDLYTDNITYTGWEGYVCCPNCHPTVDDSALRYYPDKNTYKKTVVKKYNVARNGTAFGGVLALRPKRVKKGQKNKPF